MELIKQVTSLEISKRLKELGVKQESLFYWCQDPKDGEMKMEYVIWEPETKPSDFFKPVSAFTVAELGEMLPTKIEKDFYFEEWKTNFDYTIQYKSLTRIEKWFTEKTEADARGAMLVYLLENKLLPDNHQIQ